MTKKTLINFNFIISSNFIKPKYIGNLFMLKFDHVKKSLKTTKIVIHLFLVMRY